MKLASKVLDLIDNCLIENSCTLCYNSLKEESCQNQIKTRTNQKVKLAQKIILQTQNVNTIKKFTENTYHQKSLTRYFQKDEAVQLVPVLTNNQKKIPSLIKAFKKNNTVTSDSQKFIDALNGGEVSLKYLQNIEEIPKKFKEILSNEGKPTGTFRKSYWARLKFSDSFDESNSRIVGVVDVYKSGVTFFYPDIFDLRKNINYNKIRTLSTNSSLIESGTKCPH